MTAMQADTLILIVSMIFIAQLILLIIFIFETGKLGSLLKTLQHFHDASDSEMNSIAWHERKIENETSEVISELRRIHKILYEMHGAGPGDFIQDHAPASVYRMEKADKFKTSSFNKETPTGSMTKIAVDEERKPLPPRHHSHSIA